MLTRGILAVLLTASLAAPAAAYAKEPPADNLGGRAWAENESSEPDTINLGASTSGQAARVLRGPGGGRGSSFARTYGCTFGVPEDPLVVRVLTSHFPNQGSGRWITRNCERPLPGADPGSGLGEELIWVPAGGPAAPPPDPGMLAQEVRDQLVLPHPRIRTSPSSSQDALVNFPTWLWVDAESWGPQEDSTGVRGVSVQVRAVPKRVVWRMGDGATVTCTGPGTPFVASISDAAAPSPDCGYTYPRSSDGQPEERYRITATMTWGVTWTANVPPGGGTLEDITLSSSTGLRVAEYQALNVNARP
jgi:hypothetical protein